MTPSSGPLAARLHLATGERIFVKGIPVDPSLRQLICTAGPVDNLGDLATSETRWLPAADGKTLLHGDINPSNLLVTRAGTVLLVDGAQLILAGHSPSAAEQAVADVSSR